MYTYTHTHIHTQMHLHTSGLSQVVHGACEFLSHTCVYDFICVNEHTHTHIHTHQVIVFFSSCNSVKYYAELLNFIDIPVLDLHGKQKQQKRTTTFFEFCNADKGILLCTDVAARGLGKFMFIRV
jgi:superfamily II DNA/RNA helicase